MMVGKRLSLNQALSDSVSSIEIRRFMRARNITFGGSTLYNNMPPPSNHRNKERVSKIYQIFSAWKGSFHNL